MEPELVPASPLSRAPLSAVPERGQVRRGPPLEAGRPKRGAGPWHHARVTGSCPLWDAKALPLSLRLARGLCPSPRQKFALSLGGGQQTDRRRSRLAL